VLVYGVNILNKLGVDNFNIGKTYPLEILKREGQNSLVKLNGLEVYVHLDTDALEGDRFNVRVKSLENGLIILEKLNVNTSLEAKTTLNAKDPMRLLVPLEQVGHRELPANLIESHESILLLEEAAINGNDITPKEIQHYIKTLGLDYEKRLFEGLQAGNPQLLQELKETVKGKALINPRTLDLVDWITKQQFWLNTGEQNQFILLNLFVRHKEQIKKIKIASLSPRKKNTINEEHYRIGLKASTDRFGEIGVETRIYGHSLSIQLFTEKIDALKQQVNAIYIETEESLNKAGYSLIGIEVSDLNKAKDLNLFLSGRLVTEVDVWI
jgi:hypothetical protein